MSDFLEKLAAKSLDSTTGIRPRLPSRFETPDMYASTRGFNFDAQESEAEVESDDERAHYVSPAKSKTFPTSLEPPPHKTESATLDTTPLTIINDDDETRHTRAAIASAHTATATQTPNVVSANQDSQPASQTNDSPRVEIKPHDVAATPSIAANIQPLESTNALPPRSRNQTKHTAPLTSARSTEADKFAKNKQNSPHDLSRRTVIPSQIVTQPPSAREDETFIATHHAPTINVTIRRIEVRALVAPAPPPPAPLRVGKHTPSSPSLRDYLKQRNERGHT